MDLCCPEASLASSCPLMEVQPMSKCLSLPKVKGSASTNRLPFQMSICQSEYHDRPLKGEQVLALDKCSALKDSRMVICLAQVCSPLLKS